QQVECVALVQKPARAEMNAIQAAGLVVEPARERLKDHALVDEVAVRCANAVLDSVCGDVERANPARLPQTRNDFFERMLVVDHLVVIAMRITVREIADQIEDAANRVIALPLPAALDDCKLIFRHCLRLPVVALIVPVDLGAEFGYLARLTY